MNNKNPSIKFFSYTTSWILFIIAHLFYVALVIEMTLMTKDLSLVWFDLRMFQGYNLAYATTIVSELTYANIVTYLTIILPLDIFYPIIAGLFFFVFFKIETHKWRFALLGFVAMIFDLMENIIVALMITRSLTSTLVDLGSIATIIKGIYYVFAYGLTISLIIKKIIKVKIAK